METYVEIAAPIVKFDTSHALIDLDAEERDLAAFGHALEDYKRRSGRQFPTWCEVLEVLRGLGYAKPDRTDSPLTVAKVRVNVVGPLGERVRAHLKYCGGKPTGSKTGTAYEFANEAQRSEALASVRCRFGWTCVDPEYDRTPVPPPGQSIGKALTGPVRSK